MPAPESILALVERFDRQREALRSPAYNETSLRREFLDPFFRALGWDVDNSAGSAEAYKDVVHEDAIKIGTANKAPDYSFRIGGTRKFFVEAKRPSVNIKDDPEPAYQLRRYAWSAKLPLSILTDFEELAVYDCWAKPAPTDKPSAHRTLIFHFAEYATRWDELAGIFARESVLKGSFDQYAEGKKGRRGTATVDREFLKDIESWREALARNLAIRNPKLDVRDINFAVQRTIDRIIFLRIAEDRGLEEYGRLLALTNGANSYKRLAELFVQADARYNSGLFHFRKEKDRAERPDDLTLSVTVDDKVVKDVIKALYYPDSPYEFSVVPADILGQVYEQFLGKVIRLTAGHQAKVEEKPEVRKAGGVYYTPTYIVDYIVKETIGRLLEGKSPKQADALRVVDPACGSGSFLIQAYQYLLDWYRDRYLEDSPKKHRKQLFEGPGGAWRLTSGERKRILLNNIYGVDIDAQAVEVTKLSLLLKVLEGESAEHIQHELTAVRERALPDLGNNIKCGNSLIGPDFYDQQELGDLTEDERLRVNVFDWKAEFPDVFKGKNPGFDAVIGNPPYVRSQLLQPSWRHYFANVFECATATYDIYVLFVERGLRVARSDANVGFIVPNKFFTTDYGKGLRQLLVSSKSVRRIVDFGNAQVFAGATIYTCILTLGKGAAQTPLFARLDVKGRAAKERDLREFLADFPVVAAPLAFPTAGERWSLHAGERGSVLRRLADVCRPLVSLNPHIFQGFKTSADKVFMVIVSGVGGDLVEAVNGLGESTRLEAAILKPVIKGEEVNRFGYARTEDRSIVYPYTVDDIGRATLLGSAELKRSYPHTWEYLVRYKSILGARDRGRWAQRADWFSYARVQNIGAFDAPKFLVPYMTNVLKAAWDEAGGLAFVNISTGGYGLRISGLGKSQKLLLYALLNSRVWDYCIRQLTNDFRGGYFAVNKQALERLPLPDVEAKESAVRQVAKLVSERVDAAASMPSSRVSRIERSRLASHLDSQLDLLIYGLYNLTDAEIRIVEAATAE